MQISLRYKTTAHGPDTSKPGIIVVVQGKGRRPDFCRRVDGTPLEIQCLLPSLRYAVRKLRGMERREKVERLLTAFRQFQAL